MFGIFVVEWLLGGIRIAAFAFQPAALGNQLGYFLFGAFFEEFIFRSLTLSGLVVVSFGRKWPAILITAVLFGVVHLKNAEATYVSAFGNGLGGVMYGIAFLGGRNLWLPAGMHLAWNFFQGPILGFPVSGAKGDGLLSLQITGSELLTGGKYGPEAGLVGMVFRFVVIGMVLYFLQRRCGWQGNLLRLDFPIKVYENLPRPKPVAELPPEKQD